VRRLLLPPLLLLLLLPLQACCHPDLLKPPKTPALSASVSVKDTLSLCLLALDELLEPGRLAGSE
jgi:hypothetical protein